ncbi:MAG: DHH family phosphoesterase [Christensenellaceae bacterium]|jgi:phosphoesterase RecJ-like protein
MQKQIQRIASKVKNEHDFLILGHISPDGDTLGSGLALLLALEQMGKSAIFAVDGSVPEKLKFLKKYAFVYNAKTLPKFQYHTVIAVDVSDPDRLGEFEQYYMEHGNTVVIDHHVTNNGFAHENLVLPYGATGQIILELIEALGVALNVEMANALYTALCTDTGNFSYSNTDASLLAAAAKLRAAGAEIPWLIETIYKRRSFGATKLIGQAIDRMQLTKSKKIAYTYIEQKDYETLQALAEDTDELVNYAREVEGVEIAVFMRQIGPARYKISLRSKQYADVSRLASEFGGGGHKFAAGCNLNGERKEVEKKILAAAEKYIR